MNVKKHDLISLVLHWICKNSFYRATHVKMFLV